MKIAGKGRRDEPNCLVLSSMQEYSTKGWVYREGQGWVFAELTPNELAEFKSYECGKITIPRMRIRLPYSQAIMSSYRYLENFKNWFVRCTMREVHPLLLDKFHLHHITKDKEIARFRRHPVVLGDYETWLWADEVTICQELGCKVTLHNGFGWLEWGVPPEWKEPLEYEERMFIYAFVNGITHEAYIGQTDNIERRWSEHLKDRKNPGKVGLIESIRAQGREPESIQLEEIPGEKARERERYWTSYYGDQGYKIINQDYKSLI